MAENTIHDKKYCLCVKYKPKKMKLFGVRLNGHLFRCRKCWRYVDPKKWKGGYVVFTNRSRLVKQNECPCCGRKMSKHRKAKKKLVNSNDNTIQIHKLQYNLS